MSKLHKSYPVSIRTDCARSTFRISFQVKVKQGKRKESSMLQSVWFRKRTKQTIIWPKIYETHVGHLQTNFQEVKEIFITFQTISVWFHYVLASLTPFQGPPLPKKIWTERKHSNKRLGNGSLNPQYRIKLHNLCLPRHDLSVCTWSVAEWKWHSGKVPWGSTPPKPQGLCSSQPRLPWASGGEPAGRRSFFQSKNSQFLKS